MGRRRTNKRRGRRKRTRGKKGGLFCHKWKNLVKAQKVQLAKSDFEEQIYTKMIDDMATEEEKMIDIIVKHRNSPDVQKLIEEIKKIHGLDEGFLNELAKKADTPEEKAQARKNLKDTLLPSKKKKGGKRRRTKKKRRKRRT